MGRKKTSRRKNFKPTGEQLAIHAVSPVDASFKGCLKEYLIVEINNFLSTNSKKVFDYNWIKK